MTMKNRKLQLKNKARRAVCKTHSPPAIFPISLSASLLSMVLHLCICVSLTFSLTTGCVKGVNSHTPGLHSTLMLSHDKLLSLSLISNLRLLLFPLLSLSFSHKMSLFRLKPFSTAMEDTCVSPTFLLLHKVY